MTISIIVCTRNRPKRIQRCLEALLRMHLEPVQEIIVLDQSDKPLNLEPVSAAHQGLIRYHWRQGRGLARARNQAIRLARGSICAFTDDDCLVTEDWAQQIDRTFRFNPHIDGVLGRVLAYDDGSLPITYHAWQTDFGAIHYATRSDGSTCNALITKRCASVFSHPVMPVENVGSGNNMAFRRETFVRHGLFIEMLGTGTPLGSGEDLEFHLRLLRKGDVLLYNPMMCVYHDSWLAPEQNERLHHEYTKGMIAISVGLALQGEPLAWKYLWFRCKTIRQEALVASIDPRSRRSLRYYQQRARAFWQGLQGGVLLALRYRRLIPHLN